MSPHHQAHATAAMEPSMTELQRCIDLNMEHLQSIPPNSEQYSDGLIELGQMQHIKYTCTKELQDLEQAIQSFRGAIEAIHMSNTYWPQRAVNLAGMCGLKYMCTGDIADLTEGEVVARLAVQATSAGDPAEASRWNILGALLQYKFTRTGAIEHLEESMDLLTRAVGKTPDSSSDKPMRLHNLSVLLGLKFVNMGGNTADLEEAIRMAREAVSGSAIGDPDRSERLMNLGLRLADRFKHTGDLETLEEAIYFNKQSLLWTIQNDPTESERLYNLACFLCYKFERTDSRSDLKEAIAISQNAIQLQPNNIRKGQLLGNLAAFKGKLFFRTGATVYIDDSITIAREAIKVTPENLSLSLANLCQRTGATEDFKEAITLGKEAVEATPTDHVEHPFLLEHLSWVLFQNSQFLRTMEHLNEGMDIIRRSIGLTPRDHPRYPNRLRILVLYLKADFLNTKNMDSLNEAIDLAKTAINAFPKDEPMRGYAMNNRSSVLYLRYNCSRGEADLIESKSLLQETLNSTTYPIDSRVSAGLELLANAHVFGLDSKGYSIAKATINLVPLLFPFALSPADKKHLLSDIAGLASNAASIALNSGEAAILAIELLETGRGVLASSIQDIRADISSLQKEHPTMAEEFRRLRQLLDTPSQDFASFDDRADLLPQNTGDDRFSASAQMYALLSEIRKTDGFEAFLLPPTEIDMCKAANLGPIVIINVSPHRCDAFIIQQSGIMNKGLEKLSQEAIISRFHERGSVDTLCWLWDVVVGPILGFLGFNNTPTVDPWPHMWWIPTGPLSGFPLHAAGNYLDSPCVNALDRVVSSYALSIKSIVTTRQQRYQTSSIKRVTLVEMSQTPGQAPLPHVFDEVNTVQKICVDNGLPVHRPQPCKSKTMNALKSSQFFHFSGHGSAYVDPLQSRLYLEDWKDEPFTVASLLDTNLSESSPFFAYLSACGTSQNLDNKSVDENLHLVTAFQLAGFRHVIGTLWEVNDSVCVDVARETYETLIEADFSDASVSRGLHRAIRKLRDSWLSTQQSQERADRNVHLCADMKSATPLWVPYIHYGV